MNKLRPCPFCGGVARLQKDTRYPRPEREPKEAYEVVCDNWDCPIYHADNRYSLSEKEAIQKWNKRAILSVPDTKAEWLKKSENLDGTIIYECSNCEHEIELTASPWHYDVYYCEACGADMGLDDNDEVI